MKQIAKTKSIELWLDGGVTYIRKNGKWNRLYNDNDYICFNDDMDIYLKQQMEELTGTFKIPGLQTI